MINDPERETNTTPEQLILPALPDTPVPARPAEMYPRMKQAQSGLLPRRTAPPPPLPPSPLTRLRSLWGRDPAYRVLMIAVAVVLIAGLLLATLATRAFIQNPGLFALGGAASQNPGGAAPNGTVDLRPAFPTPGGSGGSTASSQPPGQQSTPSLQPTVTSQPSPSPGQGTLTIQITTIPSQVRNYSRVPVGVNASEPNVTVYLLITYNAAPYNGYAGPRTTDGSGNASIPWTVSVYGAGRHYTAVVVAIARDQQGQQARSQAVTVQISGFPVGG